MEQIIKCPVCKKKVVYSLQNPHRPFCSDRCRLIDLGQWLVEDYKINVDDNSEDNNYMNEQ